MPEEIVDLFEVIEIDEVKDDVAFGAVAAFEVGAEGLGDVALFVRLLQKALDTQTTVNRFYQCEAKCRKGGARIRWPKEAKP